MSLLHGLPVAAGDAPEVLILGSMPGMESLRQRQYYAHPRNRFWPLMGLLYGVDPTIGYRQRLDMLQRARVALWDVLASCRRIGSLDSAIARASEAPNPVAEWIGAAAGLRAVALNGGKAAEAFDRHVAPVLAGPARFEVHRLPSTSPANAAWSLERLYQRWQVLRG